MSRETCSGGIWLDRHFQGQTWTIRLDNMLGMLFEPSTLYPRLAGKTPGLIPLKASDADGVLLNYELTLPVNVVASKSRLAWVGDMAAHDALKQESLPRPVSQRWRGFNMKYLFLH